jgi:hypothetical protein
MRNLILSSVLLAACATNTSLVHSRPAVVQYHTDVDVAKNAVHDVLATNFYVNDVGSDAFATKAVCRTEHGDVCPGHAGQANAWTPSQSTDPNVKMYALQVFAKIVPSANGVVVSVGATLGGKDASYQIGQGDVPAWLQNEVDMIQKQVRDQIKTISPESVTTAATGS